MANLDSGGREEEAASQSRFGVRYLEVHSLNFIEQVRLCGLCNVNLKACNVFDGYVGWCKSSGEPGFVQEEVPIYSGYI